MRYPESWLKMEQEISKEKQSQKNCGVCNGIGQVKIPDHPIKKYSTCTNCGGTGKVKV